MSDKEFPPIDPKSPNAEILKEMRTSYLVALETMKGCAAAAAALESHTHVPIVGVGLGLAAAAAVSKYYDHRVEYIRENGELPPVGWEPPSPLL